MTRTLSAAFSSLLLLAPFLALAPASPAAPQDPRAVDVDAALEAGLARALGEPFRAHQSLVTHVEYAPDGKLALSSSWDTFVHLWDGADGRLVRSLETDGMVHWAGFLDGGQRVLTASEPNRLEVWDTATGERLHLLEPEVGVQRAVVLGGGREVYAIHSLEGGLRHLRWTDAGLEEVGALELEHDGMLSCLAASPDGRRVAVGGLWPNFVEVFDAASGARTLSHGADAAVTALAFHPDGKSLLVGQYGALLRLELATGEVVEGWSELDFTVQGLSVSPDGKVVFLSDDDGQVYGWTLGTEETEQRLHAGEHRDTVPSTCPSPDGARLLTGSHDGSVRFWDLATGAQACVPEGPTNVPLCLGWSPDGTRLLSGCYDNSATLWDPTAADPVAHLVGHEYAVVGVGFRDGLPWTVGSDGAVVAWKDGEEVARLRLPGQPGRPTCATFAADELLIGTIEGHVLRVSGLDQPVETLARVSGFPIHVSRPAGGEGLLVVDVDGKVRRLDAAGEVASTFELSSEDGLMSAWPVGPDHLLVHDGSGTVTVRALDGGARAWARDPGDEGWTECATASADGAWVAVVDQDGLGLHDARTGERRALTGTPYRTFFHLRFSPDGTRLAAGMSDGTLLVWDVAKLLGQ